MPEITIDQSCSQSDPRSLAGPGHNTLPGALLRSVSSRALPCNTRDAGTVAAVAALPGAADGVGNRFLITVRGDLHRATMPCQFYLDAVGGRVRRAPLRGTKALRGLSRRVSSRLMQTVAFAASRVSPFAASYVEAPGGRGGITPDRGAHPCAATTAACFNSFEPSRVFPEIRGEMHPTKVGARAGDPFPPACEADHG